MQGYCNREPDKEAATDHKWIIVMKKKLKMIEKNHTLELIDKPQHKKLQESDGFIKPNWIMMIL
jgi:hypothetical protein